MRESASLFSHQSNHAEEKNKQKKQIPMSANTKTTAEKVSIAATFLSSNWDGATAQCVYRDDATHDHYVCKSESEMVDLYNLITSDSADTRRDAYSLWCSQTSHQIDYSEYEVRVSNDPSYYGSECTPDDGDRIANAICNLIEAQYPSIQIELWMDGHCSSSTSGPNEDTVNEIDEGIERNWTAAL